MKELSRRDFLKISGATSASALAAMVLAACTNGGETTTNTGSTTTNTGSSTTTNTGSTTTTPDEAPVITDENLGAAGSEIEMSAITYKHLGCAIPGLSNEFWVAFDHAVKALAAEANLPITVVSYDGEVAKELICIDNLATLGCDVIFFVANDPAAVADISRKYKDQGILMVPYAGIFEDPTCYSVSIPVGQYEMGEAMAEVASEWVDKQFPDAEDGSVGVLILGGRFAPEFTNKTDGLYEIENINSKCKILKEYLLGGAEGSQDVQGATFCDMAQVEFGTGCNVILCLGDAFMIGANESYMRYDGFEDRSNVGVFGMDCNSAICNLLLDSVEGKSVIRGATANAVAPERLFAVLSGTAVLNEKNETDLNLARVTPENAEEYLAYLAKYE